MRILHVEDDEDTRGLVEFILHGKGWQVVSVENATAAFKLAAAGGFDLYLIDNWIEGDTENALCRGLRSLDSHTPILSIPVRCFQLTSRPAHRDILKALYS